MNKIENLKKVTLSVQVGKTAEHMDLTSEALEFDFIFGIGPAGLCPFEYQLVNRNEGDTVLLQLKKEEIYIFFGHLQLPVLSLIEENDSFYLRAEIEKIVQPDSKEVIKALAELASHPGGCGCGCGC